MSMQIRETHNVSTERAKDRVLPLLNEWFGFTEDNNILSDVELNRYQNGGFVTISLGIALTKEQFAELDEAMKGE